MGKTRSNEVSTTPKTSSTTKTGKAAKDVTENISENNQQATTITYEMFQELLKVQQQTMLACFNQMIENLSHKVDGIMCDVQDLKTSINFISDDAEKKFENIKKNTERVQSEIKNVHLLNTEERDSLYEHKEKLIDLEDRQRRNNLRIDGVVENVGETWEITEQKVKEIFRNNLNIDNHIEVDRAHRVGQKRENRQRTIVLRLNKFKDKEEIKKCAKKLKGTGIYINDDFSPITLERRKDLLKTAKELRDQGKGAKVVKSKLYSWDLNVDKPVSCIPEIEG